MVRWRNGASLAWSMDADAMAARRGSRMSWRLTVVQIRRLEDAVHQSIPQVTGGGGGGGVVPLSIALIYLK